MKEFVRQKFKRMLLSVVQEVREMRCIMIWSWVYLWALGVSSRSSMPDVLAIVCQVAHLVGYVTCV